MTMTVVAMVNTMIATMAAQSAVRNFHPSQLHRSATSPVHIRSTILADTLRGTSQRSGIAAARNVSFLIFPA
jgi:hypothetical protein